MNLGKPTVKFFRYKNCMSFKRPELLYKSGDEIYVFGSQSRGSTINPEKTKPMTFGTSVGYSYHSGTGQLVES